MPGDTYLAVHGPFLPLHGDINQRQFPFRFKLVMSAESVKPRYCPVLLVLVSDGRESLNVCSSAHMSFVVDPTPSQKSPRFTSAGCGFLTNRACGRPVGWPGFPANVTLPKRRA